MVVAWWGLGRPILTVLAWPTRSRFVVWDRSLCCCAVGFWGDGFGPGLSGVPGWGAPSVTTSVSPSVASGSLLGWPSVASGVAPSFASSILSLLLSPRLSLWVLGGFVQPLPVYPVTSVAPSVPTSLPFSMASLLAPSHPPTLPLAPVSSSATLTSSQPLGPVGSVSLGSGDGVAGGSVVPGATRVVVADANLGDRLPESDQAGVYVDPLNFPEGEETDACIRSEATWGFSSGFIFHRLLLS